jgi:spermidine synthase
MKKANLLLLVFGFSGATALMYEIIWSRSLQLLFGSTVYTSSTVFSAFLIGFAAGSYGLRNMADTTSRPLFFIMLIEMGIGVYGLALVGLLRLTSSLVALVPPVLALKLAICLVVLLPPTFLFGALWPFINKYYVSSIRLLGRDVGRLYSANSLGSGLGALAAGFLLIPWWGITSTSLFASFLNLGIGVLIFGLLRRQKNGKK